MNLIRMIKGSAMFRWVFSVVCMLTLIQAASAIDVTVNVVSDYSAVGNGVTEDGAAIEAAIDYINSLGLEYEPTLVFPGGKTYVITGSSNFFAAEGRLGNKEGIKTITHDNVTVMAAGAEFLVPASYRFERTGVSSGTVNDHYAQGFVISGRNFKMIGGVVNGNLENRTIVIPTDGAGEDWGLFLKEEAVNAEISGVTFSGWGSDSVYIYGQGVFENCVFEKGRRLGVAITSVRDILSYKPIVFTDCIFRNNSTPYVEVDSPCEAPCSGIDIESNSLTGVLYVEFYGCVFEDNYGPGILVSSNSKDVQIVNCILKDRIMFGNETLGNTLIEGNIFDGSEGYIHIYNDPGKTYDPNTPGSKITGNVFTGSVDAVKFQFVAAGYPHDWTIKNNALLASSANVVLNLQGTGHVTTPNIQSSSTLAASLDLVSGEISGMGNVVLTYSGNPATADDLEATSKDWGMAAEGFTSNFAFHTVNVGSGTAGKVRLVDASDDFVDSDEAVYTYNLNVASGSQLDLNGINLYYVAGDINGTVIHGGGQLVKFNPSDCAEAISMGFALSGDLNDDCKVNLADFARLANDWAKSLLD